MRILFDTCVIIDYLTDRENSVEDAEMAILKAVLGNHEYGISTKSIADIHYYLKHIYHDEKKTRDILEILFSSFEIADLSSKAAVNALGSNINDFEDAMLVNTAIENNFDCIVTRNIKDFKKSPVRVFSPKQLINII